MIRLVKAKEKHYPLLRKMVEVSKLSFGWLYKLLLVLAIGYGMILVYKNKPAGFLYAIPLIGAVFVHQIGVMPAFRKKGLGGRMLDDVHSKHETVYLVPRPEVRGWYFKKGYRPFIFGLWCREKKDILSKMICF